MLNNWLNDVKGWAKQPYREEGDLIDWFLFVGIWVVASILWVRVIRRLAD